MKLWFLYVALPVVSSRFRSPGLSVIAHKQIAHTRFIMLQLF